MHNVKKVHYYAELMRSCEEFRVGIVILESIERINKRIIREWDRDGEGEFKEYLRRRWWELVQSN